jgi:hypothetical protein
VLPQAIAVGDPIKIYGAPNIKKLNMSNVMKYLSQIELGGAYSESVGTLLEELDFSCSEEGSENISVSGLNELRALKKINIEGLRGVSTLDLTGSLNLKEVYAKNSGLTTIQLAPGCLIETLELPTNMQVLNFNDLPLLTWDGLRTDGV